MAEESTRQANSEAACGVLRPTKVHHGCPMMTMIQLKAMIFSLSSGCFPEKKTFFVSTLGIIYIGLNRQFVDAILVSSS